MLTRLRVNGFKNLVDVDLRFGPLTCIAGVNGAGKSNIFDAIRFLSEMADKPFIEAAQSIRGGDQPKSLFTWGREGRMEFLAEMIIPTQGLDEFGQPALASASFLTYRLVLELEPQPDLNTDRIRLVWEDLTYIPTGELRAHIGFRYERAWRESVIRPSHRRTSFIKTEQSEPVGTVVRLQSDRMRQESEKQAGGGKAVGYAAARLPRTVLSSAQNSEETRTAVLVRQEMRNWKQLQLEPSALRQPDDFQSPDRLSVSGGHIPATLHRLERAAGSPANARRVLANLANRLADLVSDVEEIRVDRDDVRKVLRLMLKDRNGLELPASSLSDGTLRFIALGVIEQDPQEASVICLEEPENGIHPQRVNAMLDLLYSIAVDPEDRVGDTNPLRQIIISTHSPVVAGHVAAADLLFAGQQYQPVDGATLPSLEIRAVEGTWRTAGGVAAIGRGALIGYLRSAVTPDSATTHEPGVARRYQQQLTLPFKVAEEPDE